MMISSAVSIQPVPATKLDPLSSVYSTSHQNHSTALLSWVKRRKFFLVSILFFVVVLGQVLIYCSTLTPPTPPTEVTMHSSLSEHHRHQMDTRRILSLMDHHRPIDEKRDDDDHKRITTPSDSYRDHEPSIKEAMTQIRSIISSELNTYGMTSPISRTRHTMVRTGGKITPQKVFILPIMPSPSSDLPSFPSIHQLVEADVISCIQNEMERRQQQSGPNAHDNIRWLLYGINIVHREMIEEMSSWRFFDYVSLPYNQDYVENNCKEHPKFEYSLIETELMEHVNSLLYSTKVHPEQTFEIVNQRVMFNLEETLKLFGVEPSCLRNTAQLHLKDVRASDKQKASSVGKEMASKYDKLDGDYRGRTKKSSEMERKKFALVVPFPRSQLSQVIKQLKRWRSYRPCSGVSKVYRDKTDLIFYFHKAEDQEMEQSIMRELTKNETVNGDLRSELHCFHPNIQFWYTNLLDTEDTYPASANHMFYRLLYEPKLFTQYQYFFYAEPDTFPVRDGWLNRLLNHAYMIDSSWWISGSVYRGNLWTSGAHPTKDGDSGETSYNLHINGNALYNTAAELREFMGKVRVSMPQEAFDTASLRYLLLTNWKVTREVWNHFIFSDFIINLWRTNWKTREVVAQYPHTFFVHSKQIKQ